VTDDVVVRRATSADREALNQIMQASRAYNGVYHAIIDGYPITEEMITRDEMYLAEQSGRVIGFYSLMVDGPELDLMFVANEAQGTGAGHMLFEHMHARARSLDIARVKIVSHPPSEGFYLHMGAKRTGTRQPRGRVTWEQPILELAV
jgi:N-acetylglutamate synthase-like GNAT family acetyltransferase